jgi:hypothetical protein
MGISERLLGKKNVNGVPQIRTIEPAAALPGGEVRLIGSSLRPHELRRPVVTFSGRPGAVVVSSDSFVVARVPEDAISGPVTLEANGETSNPFDVRVAVPIADELHPVANPALDREGNIYVTFSGSRGQKVPVAIYKIDTNYDMKPFITEMMNPTGLAFDRAGYMYVSSRLDGTVYRVAPNGTMSAYAQGMGVATGIAFDDEENLYVGDRSGTIFKIARDRQIFVYATIEPSVSAYHLAFGPGGYLYVTGPTISSFEPVYRVDTHGNVEAFYRGLGRPQGLAFDVEGNLYVAASLGGKRGIVRITPEREGSLVVSGHNMVGLAFAPGRAAVLATTSALYHLSWDTQGRRLLDPEV